MRGTLLESRRRKQKGRAGIIASVGAHAAIILAVVIATASAKTPPEPAAPTVIIPVYRSDPVEASAAPAAPAAPKPAAPVKPESRPAPPLAAPSESPSESAADVPASEAGAGTSSSDAPSQPGAIGSGAPGTFSADQVEVAVRMSRGSAQPRYPFSLQSRGTEGSVQVEFVVDERGRADQSTLRILRSDHELFSAAIREALPRMRFQPAQVGGRAVRQLVQQTFQFRIDR